MLVRMNSRNFHADAKFYGTPKILWVKFSGFIDSFLNSADLNFTEFDAKQVQIWRSRSVKISQLTAKFCFQILYRPSKIRHCQAACKLIKFRLNFKRFAERKF